MLTNVGQSAAVQTGNAGMQAATNAGQLRMQGADTAAAAMMGNANQVGELSGDLLSYYAMKDNPYMYQGNYFAQP